MCAGHQACHSVQQVVSFNGQSVITVYPMLVTRQARRWPERGQRELRWFSPEEAAEAVEEPELKVIILSLNGRRETLYPRSSLIGSSC